MLELNGTEGVTSLTLLEWHLHYLILPYQTNRMAPALFDITIPN
jgi:hypothetical protein